MMTPSADCRTQQGVMYRALYLKMIAIQVRIVFAIEASGPDGKNC